MLVNFPDYQLKFDKKHQALEIQKYELKLIEINKSNTSKNYKYL